MLADRSLIAVCAWLDVAADLFRYRYRINSASASFSTWNAMHSSGIPSDIVPPLNIPYIGPLTPNVYRQFAAAFHLATGHNNRRFPSPA